MSGTDSGPTILVVDDEPEVADAYSPRLQQDYDVRTAYGGAAAMDEIGDGVDLVLLDRRMPDVSGDDVLAALREHGVRLSGHHGHGRDPRLRHPRHAVRRLPLRAGRTRRPVRRHRATARGRRPPRHGLGVLRHHGEAEPPRAAEVPVELEDHEKYQSLGERTEELEAEMGQQLEAFDDVAMAFQDIDRA